MLAFSHHKATRLCTADMRIGNHEDVRLGESFEVADVWRNTAAVNGEFWDDLMSQVGETLTEQLGHAVISIFAHFIRCRSFYTPSAKMGAQISSPYYLTDGQYFVNSSNIMTASWTNVSTAFASPIASSAFPIAGYN
ncbi:hypothetical protein GQ53DRAFT_834731 [Thozetella sp. PMI_491]|nr:hypothetical protein GQ53DRAFT_834731 [Thozetella sp. PMI_491]